MAQRSPEKKEQRNHSCSQGTCMVYVRCKTVNTCALCRSFVSSSIVSGGIFVFLCFILYDVTGDRLKLHRSPLSNENGDGKDDA